jgi:hypothetical protein
MSRVFVLLTGVFPQKSFFTASTLALSGTQQAPQSGNLLLRVRDERIRRDFPLRGNGVKCQDWVVHSI